MATIKVSNVSGYWTRSSPILMKWVDLVNGTNITVWWGLCSSGIWFCFSG
jgi:hypothetical protein